MDEQFFKDLETSISNVGTGEIWKENIGGRVIWLSPIRHDSQAKINEAMTNEAIKFNFVSESKRLMLSHSIVGIDDYDLSPYRDAGSVFGPIPLPGGKKLKVDLPTYIYHKISSWGQQFVDDCFSVLSDRIETHAKENVKSIKFDNAKHPMEELSELMVRVTELRIQLGLPELVEKEELDEAEEFERITKSEAQISNQDETQAQESDEKEFDPFKPISISEPLNVPPPHMRQRPSTHIPIADHSPPLNIPPISQPSQVVQRTPQSTVESGTPNSPFIATRSDDVVERPTSQGDVVTPPVIDPVRFGKNPRFNPQRQ